MRRIMVFAAHPDDAESGCGGIIANYNADGWEAIIVQMTYSWIPYVKRGDGSKDEVIQNRKNECLKADSIIGAHTEFLGLDEDLRIEDFSQRTEIAIDEKNLEKIEKVIQKYSPQIILAHYPVDTHEAHQATGILVTRTLMKNWHSSWDVKTLNKWLTRIPSLYYYEVLTGLQTQCFVPTTYIDISDTIQKKKRACYALESQDPDDWYPYHEEMMLFRGKEASVKYAEALVEFKKLSCPKKLFGI